MKVKNLNNLQPEPIQLIPPQNSPHKYLLLVYLSWTYLVVSLKPVLRHRYTENQPIAQPTLCFVVSILITSNHPLSLVNFLDSNVYAQIFLTMNMRFKFSLKAFYPEAILTNYFLNKSTTRHTSYEPNP